MADAAAFEQCGQKFALFNADGTHQHRLPFFVRFGDLVDDRVEFGLFGLVHHIAHVIADDRLVGGHFHDAQAIDLIELVGLGLGGTGHAGQLFVHAEIVLERDGRQRFGFLLYADTLFGLNGLMQALVEAATQHQTAGELIHNDDFAVFYHVVDIQFHDAVGANGLVDVVGQCHIVRVGKVVDVEIIFGLFDAALGQRDGLLLFDHDVVDVVAHFVVVLFFVIHIGKYLCLEALDKLVGRAVHLGGFVALAADDQRGTRLIN
ncbi:hypothetical protein SDC9_165997 [bioreactor metagenome]|uniref:NAD-specific glutamate dehydrogenase n=1 Tax=bioreactor metagenome TaxID=1076179 RepID=A0A645FXN1_9ZZZZ